MLLGFRCHRSDERFRIDDFLGKGDEGRDLAKGEVTGEFFILCRVGVGEAKGDCGRGVEEVESVNLSKTTFLLSSSGERPISFNASVTARA